MIALMHSIQYNWGMKRIHPRQLQTSIIRAILRPTPRNMILAILFVALYFFIPQPTKGGNEVIVHDGDTLTVQGQKYRLHAIDAPELAQTCQADTGKWACGQKAKDLLVALTANKTVSRTNEDNSYDRIVGQCFVDGKDIGEQMVQKGYAVAYRHFSTRYVPAETLAKKQRLGIWAGKFQNPREWRKQQ